MKRNLIILMALIMVMTVVAPSFAADDWKFSGWTQTENTWFTNLAGVDDLHEYALKARLTASKKASDQLSYDFTLATKGLYDKNAYNDREDLHEVWLRQAAVNYKFNDMVSMSMGKKPVWLGPGGLFGDDYFRGLDFSITPNSNLSMRAVYGRRDLKGADKPVNLTKDQVNDLLTDNDTDKVQLGGAPAVYDNKIGYLEANYNVPNSPLSLGAHFLRGDKVQGVQGTFDPVEDNTTIWGLSSNYQLTDDLGLSLAFAQNTDDYDTDADPRDLSDNSEIRFQAAYTGLEKTSLFFRYYNRGAGIMYPHENGNYLSNWGDKYGGTQAGFQGIRLIAVRPLTPNVSLTGVLGYYEDTEDFIDESATKNTLTLTSTF